MSEEVILLSTRRILLYFLTTFHVSKSLLITKKSFLLKKVVFGKNKDETYSKNSKSHLLIFQPRQIVEITSKINPIFSIFQKSDVAQLFKQLIFLIF